MAEKVKICEMDELLEDLARAVVALAMLEYVRKTAEELGQRP
jgi:hypothetical protein